MYINVDFYFNLQCYFLCTVHVGHFIVLSPPFLSQFRPLTIGRSPCGYVGLKNAGATCYMNTVLQQLYMQPGIREVILGVEREEEDTR